jgi:CRISPR/Cas system CSM-associated protein Csm3 (group 7 of RAMP superfamily)
MYLRVKLLSDTAFGRGDGIAGVVDNEVEHDSETGLPIVKGRTIKGLIVEACADILFGLSKCNPAAHNLFKKSANDLFGVPGSDLESNGLLHFHIATLPLDFIQKVRKSPYTPMQVLETFTSVRRQTAVDLVRDTPQDQTLRATRVVIRKTVFHAPISAERELKDEERALLAACASTMRHAGLNRTRGLGHVEVTLEGVEGASHQDCLARFETLARRTTG